MSTTLETLGTRSLKIHLRVGDQLGLAILRGEYPPGSILPSELKLCEMLGVSRTAMRALASEAGLNGEIEHQLFQALQAKDGSAVASLTATLAPAVRTAFAALPQLYGTRSVLAEARQRLPQFAI